MWIDDYKSILLPDRLGLEVRCCHLLISSVVLMILLG